MNSTHINNNHKDKENLKSSEKAKINSSKIYPLFETPQDNNV